MGLKYTFFIMIIIRRIFMQNTEKTRQCSIKELCLIEGKLSQRATSHVLEWAFLHRDELLEDWNLAREKKSPLNKIKGLE
jgi:hypothetical protein